MDLNLKIKLRESGSDFALDAGALVLADQGCCCIDEFDKMSGQVCGLFKFMNFHLNIISKHAALLEAMEQQQISVAKAGVVCTLPARTAIIAAANPVGGHYNRAKTVAENLKMGSAILSRFDLVFILIDKPDEEQDERLTEHVMALHSKHLGNQVAKFQTRGGSAQTLAGTQGIGQLAERLAPSPGLLMSFLLVIVLILFYDFCLYQVKMKIHYRSHCFESTLLMQDATSTQNWVRLLNR